MLAYILHSNLPLCVPEKEGLEWLEGLEGVSNDILIAFKIIE